LSSAIFARDVTESTGWELNFVEEFEFVTLLVVKGAALLVLEEHVTTEPNEKPAYSGIK
jgi:hypothetical protein